MDLFRQGHFGISKQKMGPGSNQVENCDADDDVGENDCDPRRHVVSSLLPTLNSVSFCFTQLSLHYRRERAKQLTLLKWQLKLTKNKHIIDENHLTVMAAEDTVTKGSCRLIGSVPK